MVSLVGVLIYGLFGLVNSFVHHEICEEIMFVDCKTEALSGNKIYRDNRGKIYDNFCSYSQAKCRDASVDLESVCTCVHPDIHAQMNTHIPTTGQTYTYQTTPPEETTLLPFLPTATEITTSPKQIVNTLQMGQPTITSEQSTNTLVSFFCQNKDMISCPSTPDPVCGSDNVSYKTRCEFTKAKCDNDNISIVREGSCS